MNQKRIASLRGLGGLLALFLAGTANLAHAQQLDYEPVDDGQEVDVADDTGVPAEKARRNSDRPERRGSRPRVDVSPYVDASQIVATSLRGGGGTETFTQVGAGINAGISTRRAEGQLGARYSHRFGWGSANDHDDISGLGRVRYDLIPRTLTLEAGGVATRTHTNYSPSTSNIGGFDNSTSVYSLFAGPSLTTRVGPLTAAGSYRFGYTRVDNASSFLPSSVANLGGFSGSTSHSLSASVGMGPGVLPVGLALSGGYDREDVDQLDQRYENKYARVDATFPVSRSLSLLAGVGYEDIEISQRSPLLDANGKPVISDSGNLVTDPNSSRQLAFDTDGLIWDVGVMWRPSSRTALSARVGERYGDTFYSGNFSYRVSRDTSLQISVYTGLSSFGRQMAGGLSALPTEFLMLQNPIDGSFGNCGIGSQGSSCLTPALSGINATNFRNRGILASLSSRAAGWNVGLAAGFDQRKYISPLLLGPVGLDGMTDETYFMSVMASRPIDQRSNFTTSIYANLFDSGVPGIPNALNIAMTAAYDRALWRGLVGQAAINLNSTRQDGFNNQVTAAALLGLRYGL